MSPDASASASHLVDVRRTFGRTGAVWGIFALGCACVAGILQLSQLRAGEAASPGVAAPLAASTNVSLRSQHSDRLAPVGSRSERLTAVAPRVAPRDAPLDRDRWTAIVIHHSGSPAGDAASIERRHFAAGLAGLGFHFVVGNGQGLDDGQVVVGFRWERQLPGAHVVSGGGSAADSLAAAMNQHAVAICLVGNGDRRAFTERQLREAVALIRALQAELGIPASRVYLHSEIAPVSDPGRCFPTGDFRSMLIP